jgi:hypothetical protein
MEFFEGNAMNVVLELKLREGCQVPRLHLPVSLVDESRIRLAGQDFTSIPSFKTRQHKCRDRMIEEGFDENKELYEVRNVRIKYYPLASSIIPATTPLSVMISPPLCNSIDKFLLRTAEWPLKPIGGLWYPQSSLGEYEVRCGIEGTSAAGTADQTQSYNGGRRVQGRIAYCYTNPTGPKRACDL